MTIEERAQIWANAYSAALTGLLVARGTSFTCSQNTEVRKRWEILLNHRLSALPSDQAVRQEFIRQGMNALTNLLISLAKALHYKFDENDIQRMYSPQAHEKEFFENQEARQLLLQLLRGKSAIKIEVKQEKSD